MGSTYVVGISGGSGSGKTSFVRTLRKRLGDQATFISQDDYYFPMETQQTDEKGVHNFDLPTSIDSATMAAEVRRVLAGETVKRKEYTFETVYRDDGTEEKNKHEADMHEFKPNPILILEGLFCLHEPELRELMDLTVYVNASDVAKLSRRIKRDRLERALPLEDVVYRYEKHVLPSYQQYIKPHRAIADIVVNNNISYDKGLEVLLSHLQTKLPK